MQLFNADATIFFKKLKKKLGGQKFPILRRHYLWTDHAYLKKYMVNKVISTAVPGKYWRLKRDTFHLNFLFNKMFDIHPDLFRDLFYH